ncbi:hypothetical protein [Umezawaea sp. Da 62-37]|uniref:hypothetical protein n=1 Tax=Umezawaea sp. Da 62-37 TaxID=3075927 RepID=UPI0028F7267F|nr:hypothetical protein [Umezawaea sp. Da 62-37]WNV85059.1 hypothetical protein RM788_44090 [Umezawaea sp. Da 62-37]
MSNTSPADQALGTRADRMHADLDTANALAGGRAQALADLATAAHDLRSELLATVDDLPTLLAGVPAATATAVMTAVNGTVRAAHDLALRAAGYTDLDSHDMVYPRHHRRPAAARLDRDPRHDRRHRQRITILRAAARLVADLPAR